MEKDSWVREEIEMAIDAKKHFIPVDPDHKFNGIPTGTPSGIADIVGTHQHSAIDFGQALGATIDLMARNRIAPYATKGSSSVTKWIWAFAVIIVIAVMGIIFLYLKSQEPEKGTRTYSKTYSEQLLEAANANDKIAQYYLGLA